MFSNLIFAPIGAFSNIITAQSQDMPSDSIPSLFFKQYANIRQQVIDYYLDICWALCIPYAPGQVSHA